MKKTFMLFVIISTFILTSGFTKSEKTNKSPEINPQKLMEELKIIDCEGEYLDNNLIKFNNRQLNLPKFAYYKINMEKGELHIADTLMNPDNLNFPSIYFEKTSRNINIFTVQYLDVEETIYYNISIKMSDDLYFFLTNFSLPIQSNDKIFERLMDSINIYDKIKTNIEQRDLKNEINSNQEIASENYISLEPSTIHLPDLIDSGAGGSSPKPLSTYCGYSNQPSTDLDYFTNNDGILLEYENKYYNKAYGLQNKNSETRCNDAIVNLIPEDLFFTMGMTFHIGKEYGFFINTTSGGYRSSYRSSVLVFNITYSIFTEKGSIEIKPLIKRNYESDIKDFVDWDNYYDKNLQRVVIPLLYMGLENTNSLFLKDVSTTFVIENADSANAWDSNYDLYKDSGRYFIENSYEAEGVGTKKNNGVFTYENVRFGLDYLVSAIPYVGPFISHGWAIGENLVNGKYNDSRESIVIENNAIIESYGNSFGTHIQENGKLIRIINAKPVPNEQRPMLIGIGNKVLAIYKTSANDAVIKVNNNYTAIIEASIYEDTSSGYWLTNNLTITPKTSRGFLIKGNPVFNSSSNENFNKYLNSDEIHYYNFNPLKNATYKFNAKSSRNIEMSLLDSLGNIIIKNYSNSNNTEITKFLEKNKNYKIAIRHLDGVGGSYNFVVNVEQDVSTKTYNLMQHNYGYKEQYFFEELSQQINIKELIIDTKRLRTGYIDKEYIVLSPRREGAGEAYIEYSFNIPIYQIDIELAFWSDQEYAMLKALIEYQNDEGEWHTKLDLLNDITLSKNRKNIDTYSLNFETPITKFRVYASALPNGTNNKGRICIGNLTIYTN